MNKFFITCMLFIMSMMVYAQNDNETRVAEIKKDMDRIHQQEKEALNLKVEEINNAFDNGTITKSEADIQKREAAEETARRIEDRIYPLEKELDRLAESELAVDMDFEEDRDTSIIEDLRELGEKIKRGPYKSDKMKKNKSRSESRNTSQFVFAWGFNNLMTEDDFGSLQSNDLNSGNSFFTEWGVSWKRRLTPNSALMNLKYGFSFTYNNYRPTENRYFVKEDNITQLAEFHSGLDRDAKLRIVNFVLPIHFEFDFSRAKIVDGDKVVKTQKGTRIGIGAYGGVNYRERQFLHYNENGIRTEIRQRGNFNASNLMGGLSAYIGYRDVSLYARYELTPLFANNDIDLHPVSLAVRFDFN